MKKWVKRFLFFFVMLLLFSPLIQEYSGLIKFKPVFGYYHQKEKPRLSYFSWNRWFSGQFQDTLQAAMQDNVAFRELLIRLNNQLKYSLFAKTDMQNIVIGKNDHLYEEGYILDYIGKNFVGKNFIDEKLRRTKWVQEYLKKEKNIDLLIVFEPGRASFFPEYIPNAYHAEQKTISNYDYYSKKCKELNIKHLDLNAYFRSIKKTSKYPLYPKFGVHWSSYGMAVAVDTLLKFIENVRNVELNHFEWKNLHFSNQFTDADWDIEMLMNLMWKLKQVDTMAYPQIHFENNNGKTKPDVLTIGDSYCWSIFDAKIPHNLFKNTDFWYYNHTLYPNYWDGNHTVEQLNFKEEVEKRQVLLVMITELNLYNAFWGFTDQLYHLYSKEAIPSPFYEAKTQWIANDKDLAITRKQAEMYKISVEQMLNIGALRNMKLPSHSGL